MTGAEIRHHRELKGWTKEVLAEQLGIHVHTLNRYEHGTTSPSRFIQAKACRIFGIREDQHVRDVIKGIIPAAEQPYWKWAADFAEDQELTLTAYLRGLVVDDYHRHHPPVREGWKR